MIGLECGLSPMAGSCIDPCSAGRLIRASRIFEEAEVESCRHREAHDVPGARLIWQVLDI